MRGQGTRHGVQVTGCTARQEEIRMYIQEDVSRFISLYTRMSHKERDKESR